MGLFGPPDVAKLEAKGDVPGLIRALGYEKDSAVRQAAATALGQIRNADAVEPLIVNLRDPDVAARQAAATALGQIGDARAVEPLVRLAALNDADPDVRNAAAKALVTLGPGAVKPLITALRSRAAEVRQAAEALGQIGLPAIQLLVDALGEQDADLRSAAADALGKLGWQPDMTVTGAIYWVYKREWGTCVEIGAPAVEPLIAALRDKDGEVREAAAAALIQIGAPSVQPLIAALDDDDEDYEVRKVAATALGKLGDVRAVKPLTSVLHAFFWNDLCEAAIQALGEIGDTGAVEYLTSRLEHDRSRLGRDACAAALQKLGWRPDNSGAAAVYWVDRGEWAKCVEIGAAAVGPLIAVLESGEDGVNLPAAEALGQIGDPRALEPLLAAVRKITLEIERQTPDIWEVLRRNITLETNPKEAHLQAVKSKLTHAAAEVAAAQLEPKRGPSEGT